MEGDSYVVVLYCIVLYSSLSADHKPTDALLFSCSVFSFFAYCLFTIVAAFDFYSAGVRSGNFFPGSVTLIEHQEPSENLAETHGNIHY